jgi:hypothetical protein
MASANITGPSVAVPTITHRSATWAFKRQLRDDACSSRHSDAVFAVLNYNAGA